MSKRKKGSSDIEVRKDIPPEVEKEFQRQWNERFLESPPRAYTIEEYMKRRREMKEFAHNFWKEYEEKSKKTEKK